MENTQLKAEERNQVEDMEEVRLGLNQELARVVYTADAPTKKLVSDFTEIYDKKWLELKYQQTRDSEKEKGAEIWGKSSAYDAIKEFLEDEPERDLSTMSAKEIAEVYDLKIDEEVRRDKLQTLRQEEAEKRIARLKNEKSVEEFKEMKERRARNRENQERLFGKVVFFGDDYVIRPPVDQPDRVWKYEEDPFGIRSVRFEEEGKTIVDDGDYPGEIVTWEEYKRIRQDMEANAEERVNTLLRSDMEIEEAYERVDEF